MFAGIITSAKLNESSVSFRMFGRNTENGVLQHKTFSIEGNGVIAAREYLKCVDNETYCYVFNQYGDGYLDKCPWGWVDDHWRVKGLAVAVIKNGKAKVKF